MTFVASMVILIEVCYASVAAPGWVCISRVGELVCFRNEARVECGPPQFRKREKAG